MHDIFKVFTSPHKERVKHYSKLSNSIKSLFDNIIKNKKILKTDLKKIGDYVNEILTNIKYKRNSQYIAHDDDYGLKDLEYTFGYIDDYYKPIFAGQSFYDNETSTFNHQYYICRGTRYNNESIDRYFDNVQPRLVQLIKEKQTKDLKIKMTIGVKFYDSLKKKGFVYYVQTNNITAQPTDNDEDIFNKLKSDFLREYNDRTKKIGAGTGYE